MYKVAFGKCSTWAARKRLPILNASHLTKEKGQEWERKACLQLDYWHPVFESVTVLPCQLAVVNGP